MLNLSLHRLYCLTFSICRLYTSHVILLPNSSSRCNNTFCQKYVHLVFKTAKGGKFCFNEQRFYSVGATTLDRKHCSQLTHFKIKKLLAVLICNKPVFFTVKPYLWCINAYLKLEAPRLSCHPWCQFIYSFAVQP